MAYRFSIRKPIPDNVRRVAREQIDGAIARLTDPVIEPHLAVHEARKHFKKIRALLRLVRLELGGVYRRENALFRDLGRSLSQVRDAEAMIETFDKLARRYRPQLDAESRSLLRQALVERRDFVASQVVGLEEQRRAAAETLAAARERLAGWPLAGAGFETVGPSLERIYRQGRDNFRDAYANPDAMHFHEWRKSAKNLWYHLRLLAGAWPQVLGVQRDEAERLTEFLGDEHDLAVLRATLQSEALGQGLDEARALLDRLAEKRQGELRTEAEPLGARLYAERPAAFRRRLAAYWVVAENRATRARSRPSRGKAG